MRVVGIVRVSQAAGREGESFVSPEEQRGRIRDACEREGWELVAVHDEIDVSGGTPLEEREGLLAAVRAIEQGQASTLMVAYFDRLVRSLRVQDEVVSRVEGAGGKVIALDVGQITGKTAAQWISGTMLGAVSEYYRRSARERIGASVAAAVERGVVPWPSIPPGYVRGETGALVPDPATRLSVQRAFNLRMDGAAITEVREFLRENGIVRAYGPVTAMLASRVYLGEIHFGALRNLRAHEPIVERGVWEAVQRVRTPRGPRGRSQRLLARLGILRCGSCGARLVASSAKTQALYRCPPHGDCSERVTITAGIAERVVVDEVLRVWGSLEGQGSAIREAQQAQTDAEMAQADMDAAIRAFAGLEGEAAAVDRLRELRGIRDAAVERANHLRRLHSALRLNLAEDWDELTLSERRTIIRAAVDRATVRRGGKGAERITVTLREDPAGR